MRFWNKRGKEKEIEVIEQDIKEVTSAIWQECF